MKPSDFFTAGFWFWWFTRTPEEVSVSLQQKIYLDPMSQNKSRVVQQRINIVTCTLIICGWFWHLDCGPGLWRWTGGGLVSGRDRPHWAWTDWMLWYRWRKSHQSWAQRSFHTGHTFRTVLIRPDALKSFTHTEQHGPGLSLKTGPYTSKSTPVRVTDFQQ